MNRPKLKTLKENLKITMYTLGESSYIEHKPIVNALLRIEETLYEVIKTLEELDEEKRR